MRGRWMWHCCSLFFVILLAAIGVWTFALGFLLSRVELSDKAVCESQLAGGSRKGVSCYPSLKPVFNRAVIIVVDALKYDFLLTNHSIKAGKGRSYENKLPVVDHLLKHGPENAALFKFIADPPTTTMQRLKGLTTGSLPTFVDVGSNFDAGSISEDNIVDKIKELGKNATFMGDDTWIQLFPKSFAKAFPFPSFDVRDLDTVDRGVMQHLVPEMKKKDWSVLVAHFLGVDHCGHRYGRDHQEMARKLKEMNEMVRSVVQTLQDDTVLFLMGDHGMTRSGDHGGDSKDEVEAGLFVYSRKKFIDGNLLPDTIAQVDFVPTFSLLLGHPIPFSNLGRIIPGFFSDPNDPSRLETALRINAHQVWSFVQKYSQKASDFPPASLRRLEALFQNATSSPFHLVAYQSFFQETLDICRTLWARFDTKLIWLGVLFVGASVALPLLVLVFISSFGWTQSLIALVAVAASVFHFFSMFSNSFQVHEDVSVQCILQALIWTHFITTPPRRSRQARGHFFRCLLLSVAVRCMEFYRRCREEQSECKVSELSIDFDSIPFQSDLYYLRRGLNVIAYLLIGSISWMSLEKHLNKNGQVLLLVVILFCLYFSGENAFDFHTVFAPRLLYISTLGVLIFLFLSPNISLQKPRKNQSNTEHGDALTNGEVVANGSSRRHSQPEVTSYSRADFPANVDYALQTFSQVLCIVLTLFLCTVTGGTWNAVLVGLPVLTRLHFLDSPDSSDGVGRLVMWAFMSWHMFFSTGHQTTFTTLHWNSAFVGIGEESGKDSQLFQKILMGSETFAGQISGAWAVPLMMMWRERGDSYWLQNPEVYSRSLWKCCLSYQLWHSSKFFFVMLNAAVNRRHLMVWKIFAPRFIYEALSFACSSSALLLAFLYSSRAFSVFFTYIADRQVPLLQYPSRRTKDIGDMAKSFRKRR